MTLTNSQAISVAVIANSCHFKHGGDQRSRFDFAEIMVTPEKRDANHLLPSRSNAGHLPELQD
jgi:hypothetical protein